MDRQFLSSKVRLIRISWRTLKKSIHWWRCPGVRRIGPRKSVPTVEAQTVFAWPSRISVGDGVTFLRGAMILADRAGSISLANNAAVGRYAILQCVGGTIQIGENSAVGDFCNLYGQGGLTVGRNVMIASGCRIVPNQHTFVSRALPINEQPCVAVGVSIGDGSWIGANVVVLDGVKIGVGTIIGAGSVVNRSIPDYSIAAGVPARVLRERPGGTAQRDEGLP